MAVVDRPELWEGLRRAAATAREELSPQVDLVHAGGGGQPPGMDTEIALLKQRADQADQRLGRMEGKLDQIGETLRGLSTKEDVKRAESAAWTALGVGGGIAFTVVAIFVGTLAYLQDQRIATRPDPAPVQAAAPAPVIIQMPPWPTAPPPPAPTPPQP